MNNERTLLLLLHKALPGYDGGNDGPGFFLTAQALGLPTALPEEGKGKSCANGDWSEGEANGLFYLAF
jgi:hypothetical protein